MSSKTPSIQALCQQIWGGWGDLVSTAHWAKWGGSGGLTYFWIKKVAKIMIFGSIFTYFKENK